VTPDSLIAHTPKKMHVTQTLLHTPFRLSRKIEIWSPLRVEIAVVESPGFLRRSHAIVNALCSNSCRLIFGCVPNALIIM